ncbi:MAG: hypothetical protein GY765_04880 [bacterium]|nr:hypothetical protein [bacterium]
MKKSIIRLSILLPVLLLCLWSSDNPGTQFPKSNTPVTEALGHVVSKHIPPSKPFSNPAVSTCNIPLYFMSNKGQMNSKALFYAKTSRYTLWLTRDSLYFESSRRIPVTIRKEPATQVGMPATQERYGTTDAPGHAAGNLAKKFRYRREVSQLNFPGANGNPEVMPLKETPLRVNYFKGNKPGKRHHEVPTFAAVQYTNLYNHIDLKVYGVEQQIEYDWVVRPGGSPADIQMRYGGSGDTRLDAQGNLLIETAGGTLMHKAPICYQETDEGRVAVKAAFERKEHDTYGFTVAAYDRNRELIIDPVVLAFSSYLGGSGYDTAYALTVNNSGHAFLTGYTTSTNFPCQGEYETDLPDWDIFVSRINTVTGTLIYSTYYGGSAKDTGQAIAEHNGYVYVTGSTYSTDFPTQRGCQATNAGGSDAFLLTLDTDETGSSSLFYATYLGSSGSDSAGGIDVGSNMTAYIGGSTSGSDFPTKNAYQTDQPSGDGFVCRIRTEFTGTDSLLFSTYLGGESGDYINDLVVDGLANAYVTGYTTSGNFPRNNYYQANNAGSQDAFVSRLNTVAGTLVYSTYLGGSGMDTGVAIAIDQSGYVYVSGNTYSSNFPYLNGFQSSRGTPPSTFITKLDPLTSGASSLVYSTYLGGNGSDISSGVVAGISGNVYISGYTDSSDFPLLNPYQVNQTGTDVFVTQLNALRNGAAGLVFSTYLGRESTDNSEGLAVDSNGYMYVAGSTDSALFPLENHYQGNQSGRDAFLIRLSPLTARYYTFHGANFNGTVGDDIAIFRPDNGRWCVRGQASVTWGTSTDIPVPGDYDGDGDTDFAVYRPSGGLWCVRGQASIPWGTSTDIPVPGDYDGDGVTDIAVYRPSNGRWCIRGQASIPWGVSTDIPIPADYDGDGDTDIAVFRPSNGRWCIQGQASIPWGVSTDIPVPGDYDGDGDDDITIYRPSNGRWCIWGQASTAWGTATDIPVPADYDGDGDTDIAVYRPSHGLWAVRGTPSVRYGTITDIPLITHKAD